MVGVVVVGGAGVGVWCGVVVDDPQPAVTPVSKAAAVMMVLVSVMPGIVRI